PRRVLVAVGLYEVGPREVARRDAALGLPLAARAVTARARHGRGGHVQVSDHRAYLTPRRALAAKVYGATAPPLRVESARGSCLRGLRLLRGRGARRRGDDDERE